MLSIIMPSNRPFSAALRALDSALQYVEKRGGMLIVSDNSGDARKQKALLGCSPNLTYSVPEDKSAKGNFLNALRLAETEFVMVMGDDDEIYEAPEQTPFDLAGLADDFIGVKPLIAVTDSEGKVKRVKDFSLQQETPSGRIFAYNENSGGDNSAFYSIFRRGPFLALMDLFYAAHPTKPANADWALAYTLFSYGKLAYDPSSILKYNFHNWETDEQVDAAVEGIFTAASLDKQAKHYRQLLIYIDMMILSHSHASPLATSQKADIAENAARSFFLGFLNRVKREPETYGAQAVLTVDHILAQADRASQDDLARAIDLTAFIDPSLPMRYRQFREQSQAPGSMALPA